MRKIILILVFASITCQVQSQTSIDLNGSSDYIAIDDDASLDINGFFTIEAWIKPDDISVEKTILIKGNNGQCGNYGLFIKDGNLAFVSDGDCNWAVSRGANSPLQVGVWQHVAATSSGNNVLLYLNGQLTDTLIRSAAAGSDNNDELWIGRSVFSTTNYFFDGLIEEVRIWNEVRSQTEIQNNLNTELSGLEPNLVAYYKFDDIEFDCDIEDCSVNENHGTRINIAEPNNLPVYTSDQPVNLLNVDCGFTFNDCITFAGEFQLFADSVLLNLQSPNDLSFLNDEILVTQLIEDLKYYYNNRSLIVDEYYNFLEDLCITYPSFFHINQTFDDTQYLYLGSLKEQVYMFLRDYLRYYPEKENQFISALNLSNPNASAYLNLWTNYEILVVDNYSLTSQQLSVIDNILATLPENITNLGTILYREFYTNDFQNAIYTTQFVSAINSFGNNIGTVNDNGFPDNFQTSISDLFSIALSHEICHTIDNDYITLNSRLFNWKNSLLSAAGVNYNEYLRSKVLDVGGNDFFQIYPQEFYASLANVYMNNSVLTLELAIDRFNNGYEQPINQFLLMADALSSEGNTTQFYRIDENSNVSLTIHDIERNTNGFINKIFITNQCAIEFTYDSNNFVESMVIPNLNSNQCNITLGLVELGEEKNIKIYPNPTNGLIYIENYDLDDYNLRIHDIYGNLILSQSRTNIIDLENFNSGVYFIEISSFSSNKKIIRKIIKK